LIRVAKKNTIFFIYQFFSWWFRGQSLSLQAKSEIGMDGGHAVQYLEDLQQIINHL